MPTTPTISFTEAFQALPDAIKTWLASDQVTSYIFEINKKLGLKDEKRSIVPGLLLRLTVKDLNPQDFINELCLALGMNYQAAKALTQELEQKILNPIAQGLRQDVGIDIKAIYFGKPAAREEGPAPLPTAVAPEQAEVRPGAPRWQAPALPRAVVPERPAVKESAAPQPTTPEVEIPTTPAVSEAPALVYKKGTFGRIPITPPRPTEGLGPSIKPFKAEPSDFKTKPIAEPETQTQIKPKVVPPPPMSPKTTQIAHINLRPTTYDLRPSMRVVHYSQFYTPLNSLGLEKKPHKAEPSGFRPEPKKEDVILDGNLVDLRFT